MRPLTIVPCLLFYALCDSQLHLSGVSFVKSTLLALVVLFFPLPLLNRVPTRRSPGNVHRPVCVNQEFCAEGVRLFNFQQVCDSFSWRTVYPL